MITQRGNGTVVISAIARSRKFFRDKLGLPFFLLQMPADFRK